MGVSEGCQGGLFQRPSRKIADETWIFWGFNDFFNKQTNPGCFAILGAYPEVEMQNDMQQLQQAWFGTDASLLKRRCWIKWGFAKENESSAASNPHVLRNQDVACFVT